MFIYIFISIHFNENILLRLIEIESIANIWNRNFKVQAHTNIRAYGKQNSPLQGNIDKILSCAIEKRNCIQILSQNEGLLESFV